MNWSEKRITFSIFNLVCVEQAKYLEYNWCGQMIDNIRLFN